MLGPRKLRFVTPIRVSTVTRLVYSANGRWRHKAYSSKSTKGIVTYSAKYPTLPGIYLPKVLNGIPRKVTTERTKQNKTIIYY